MSFSIVVNFKELLLFIDNKAPITVAKLVVQAASGRPFNLTGKLTLVYLESKFLDNHLIEVYAIVAFYLAEPKSAKYKSYYPI